ncbi:MAG: hypothetical protein ACK42L_05290 [Thermoanaerobaculum sp.]
MGAGTKALAVAVMVALLLTAHAWGGGTGIGVKVFVTPELFALFAQKNASHPLPAASTSQPATWVLIWDQQRWQVQRFNACGQKLRDSRTVYLKREGRFLTLASM